MSDMRVQALGLQLSYGATAVLRGVDVSIGSGEAVAIVGPSGSGKSTLLYCLAGLEKPDTGSVVVDGADVWGMSADARAAWRLASCGFVFQSSDLVPELTLAENVALPLELQGARRSSARRSALELLTELGVAEAAQRRPADVSGGQRQRAAIARALVSTPSIIFADEPTGALDTENRDVVMGLLREQARARGASLVLVTHDAQVAGWMDRQIVLRDGQVA